MLYNATYALRPGLIEGHPVDPGMPAMLLGAGIQPIGDDIRMAG
jgi:hypothetical protein